MEDWKYAQKHSSERLAHLKFFSVVKHQANGDFLFRITVHEYATPEIGAMRFFAETDRQTNQDFAPFTPVGWGNTLLAALSDCITNLHRFPYQGPETKSETVGA